MAMSTKTYDRVFVVTYTAVHNLEMPHDIPKLLKTMLEAGPFTQAKLADRLSTKHNPVTQPQISRWMKGQDPERSNYDRILDVATKLGVLQDVRSEDVAAGLPEPIRSRTVKLKGYVGAGSVAHFYAVADDDFEEVEAPLSATDQTIAVEIRGQSFGPLMDSWLVYYDDVRSPITEDLVGKICVVGLSDDRILIKKIVRDGNGGFNLKSNSESEPDMLDVDIEWAARVTDMKPRS